MKNISIQNTEDKSPTLYSELYKEHYHSTFGAVNESKHIFINAGLKQVKNKKISIFEMGFGSGLNALLTLEYAINHNLNINYHTVEKHPILEDVYTKLEFVKGTENNFNKLHNAPWGKEIKINENFSLKKINIDLNAYNHIEKYDLVYFDAFSPDIQANLWSEEIFAKIYKQMNAGGIFMTYSVKGIVKRALKSVGFKIEKIPGPKGKREILRAYK